MNKTRKPSTRHSNPLPPVAAPQDSDPHVAHALNSLTQLADLIEDMEDGRKAMHAGHYQRAAVLGLELLTSYGDFPQVGALVLQRRSLGELAENLFGA